MNRAEGKIVLPPGCRPSRACSEDMTRIGLRHAWLKRRGEGMWLLATDSYIAVALKVTGDGLQQGIIPFEALQAIEAGGTAGQISPTAWSVSPDGRTKATYEPGWSSYDKLPDFDKVADGALFSDDIGITSEFAVDHHNIARIAEALGCDAQAKALRIWSGGGLKPLRVTGPMLGCRGLVMPVRIT